MQTVFPINSRISFATLPSLSMAIVPQGKVMWCTLWWRNLRWENVCNRDYNSQDFRPRHSSKTHKTIKSSSEFTGKLWKHPVMCPSPLPSYPMPQWAVWSVWQWDCCMSRCCTPCLVQKPLPYSHALLPCLTLYASTGSCVPCPLPNRHDTLWVCIYRFFSLP